MNHSLNHLDDCIFDYLALHADKPVSLAKIFDDIRTDSGHRCSELTDNSNHRRYFLTTCYSLDKNYKNIKKVYWNNKLYLMFQKDKKDTQFDENIYNDPLYDGNYWNNEYNVKNVVDYLCTESIFNDFEDYYYSDLFDDSDTLLHLFVRYNRYDELVNVLENHKIDLNKRNVHGDTPLDLAIKLGDKKMIKLLINKWNDEPHIKELKRKPNVYSQYDQVVVANETIRSNNWRVTDLVYLFGVWYILVNLYYMYNYITA